MRPLNSKQKAALQPFLDALIVRYAEVAEKGETERDDPLCAEAGLGRCFACPVFGEEARGTPEKWYHCDEILPPAPEVGVADRDDGVFLARGADRLIGKAKQTARDKAKAWAAEMVAFFDGLRQE